MSCYCQVEVTKVENVLEITSPGPQGIPGGDAPDVQIEYSADNLTWAETYMEGDYYARFSTDGGDTWGTGVMFRGPQGEQGVQGDIGPQGPVGEGLSILGTLTSVEELPVSGTTGDAYIIDGDLYVWADTEWLNVGEIQGPQGIQGVQGDPGTPAPELDIQYSADNSSWSDSYTAGDFYARFSTDGGSTWGSGLLIRGEQGLQGDEGPTGDTGPQGPAGTPAPALEIEYSADEVSWSPTYTTGDYYARFSVDGGSTWGAGLLFRGPQGEIGLTGAEGPQGPAGPAGEDGTDGLDGLDGADGRTILSGTVDPTNEGVDGDFYLNTATSTLYGPKNVTWPTGVSLVGPAGTDGEDGIDGASGVSLGLVIALS